MPKGNRQVPWDCWMAERKSAAVSSSQWTDNLACDQPDWAQKTSNPAMIAELRIMSLAN